MYEAMSSGDVPVSTAESRAGSRNFVVTNKVLHRASFDSEYVRRLKEGDHATEQHFTSYFGELLLIKLRARMLPPQTVEDVRQETFLRVFTALKTKNSLQSPESLGAFVNSISNNVLMELYRKHSRTRSVEYDEQYDSPDGRSTAESEMVSEERRQEVRNVLDELSDNDRRLLRMVFFEEANLDEICRSFRVGRAYVRVLVHRAKARFRERMLNRQAQNGTARA
jgi:RNA polymerase sigma-70 factor (ECF subfamily)